LQAFNVAGFAFVGNVVGAARETIDRFDRPAQLFGQQNRRDREIFVVIDRHCGILSWRCRGRSKQVGGDKRFGG